MSVPIYSRRQDRRYLGNDNSRHVHDLRNEHTNCEIDQIFRSAHAVTFEPDALGQAHALGYNNCYWCIGGSPG